jgi:hypothetical protein
MTKLTKKAKAQILEEAGYKYSFDRELYLNRKAKKAFSVDFIEDHSEQEIENCIRENTVGTEGWRFFFNNPPSQAVERELSSMLG